MIDQNISNAVSAILAAVRIGIEWGRPWIKPGKTNDNTKISDQENTITKALGVLAENGLYAMAVFLVSCKNETYGDLVLTRHLAGLWQEAKIETGRILIPQGQEKANKEDMFGAIQKIADDLPQLILAKKLAEQAMTFARYHAKAEVKAPAAGEQP